MELFEKILNVEYSLGDLQDFRNKYSEKELELLKKELYFIVYGIDFLQSGKNFF